MVSGPRKPKKVSKIPWERRIRMDQECPRKGNGPRMPKKEEMGQGSP